MDFLCFMHCLCIRSNLEEFDLFFLKNLWSIDSEFGNFWSFVFRFTVHKPLDMIYFFFNKK